MREDAVERRRREEVEEVRRRAEEEVMEARKRELVERAMVERWGVRGRRVSQLKTSGDESKEPPVSQHATARLDWIRQRDGLRYSTAHEQKQYNGSRRDSAGLQSGRHGQRRADDSRLIHSERAEDWRYEDEKRRLYSAEYLRSLGYDVASEDERELQNVQPERWSW